MAFFQQQSMIGDYKPALTSQVDAPTETIEGRVGNILKTDAQGTYTSPVVRQAVDRQEQAFNARGLRNSSMALQAGQEAAISKAVDIAAPDAQTYYNNRRANTDATNTFARDQTMFGYDMDKQKDAQDFDLTKQHDSQEFDLKKQRETQAFTTRQDYQKALQTISTNFQRQIDTINASDMTPGDKNIAIQQAAAMRDGEIAFQNTLYSKMPQWQNEWLASAVGTAGMDIESITNPDTLANIANDPAQPQALRDAAAARLPGVRAGGGGGAYTPGTPGTQEQISQATGGVGGVSSASTGATGTTGGSSGAPSAYGAFPTMVNGMTVNWEDPTAATGQSMRQQYNNYLASAKASGLRTDLIQSPTQFALWWQQTYGRAGASSIGGGGAGGDADGNASAGTAASGDSGIGAGMSA